MKNTKKRIKTPTYILTLKLKLKTNAYEEAILKDSTWLDTQMIVHFCVVIIKLQIKSKLQLSNG